jgi:ribosomal protein S18 acetylase RimI-like enzyme
MIGEKSTWNQGYGTDTMRTLLQHGFETLNLHRIWLQVYAKNPRGIRAYEKPASCMKVIFRQAHYQHGKYFDVHLMSVLRDEWRRSKYIGIGLVEKDFILCQNRTCNTIYSMGISSYLRVQLT